MRDSNILSKERIQQMDAVRTHDLLKTISSKEINKFYNDIEGLKLVDKNGVEYWNSRSYAEFLGFDMTSYNKSFIDLVYRSMESARSNGINVKETFILVDDMYEEEVEDMGLNHYDINISEYTPNCSDTDGESGDVNISQYTAKCSIGLKELRFSEIGSGAIRKLNNVFLLARPACYYVAMNARFRKDRPNVALAQQYFLANTLTVEDFRNRVDMVNKLDNRESLTSSDKFITRIILQTFKSTAILADLKSQFDETLFGLPTAKLKELYGIPNAKPLYDIYNNDVLVSCKIFSNLLIGRAIEIKGLKDYSEVVYDSKEINGIIRSLFHYIVGENPEDFLGKIDTDELWKKYRDSIAHFFKSMPNQYTSISRMIVKRDDH